MRITEKDLRESVDELNKKFGLNLKLGTSFVCGSVYNLFEMPNYKRINKQAYLNTREMSALLDGLWKGMEFKMDDSFWFKGHKVHPMVETKVKF